MANLTKQQTDVLQRKMELDLARVVKEARDAAGPDVKTNYADYVDGVADSADEAAAHMLIATGDAIGEQHVEQMRDLTAALQRVKTGAYGTCIDCGGDIDFDRLSVYPTAKRCIACQSHHEKTYANRPTPAS